MNVETHRLWNESVKAFDEADLERCLELLEAMPTPTAQILYNLAVVHGRLGRQEDAVQRLTEAIEKNAYLAAAFYRRGYTYFLLKRYKEAIEDFESCAGLFRSSTNHVNYTQMGLALKLYRADVNVNSGICYLLNGNMVKGVELIRLAQKDPSGRNSSVIKQILSQLEQFKTDVNAALIPLPDVAPLFRPLKNLPEKPIDFLGKSKVIASKDAENSPNKLDQAPTPDHSTVQVSVPSPPADAPPRRPPSPELNHDLPPEYPHARPDFPPPRS